MWSSSVSSLLYPNPCPMPRQVSHFSRVTSFITVNSGVRKSLCGGARFPAPWPPSTRSAVEFTHARTRGRRIAR